MLINFRLAEEKKEEGNQHYKQKQYREALSKYSEAIGEIWIKLANQFSIWKVLPKHSFLKFLSSGSHHILDIKTSQKCSKCSAKMCKYCRSAVCHCEVWRKTKLKLKTLIWLWDLSCNPLTMDQVRLDWWLHLQDLIHSNYKTSLIAWEAN